VDRSIFEIISVESEVCCIFFCATGPIEELEIKAQLRFCKDKHHLKRYTFLLPLHSFSSIRSKRMPVSMLSTFLSWP
jgi:hypothetical protein